MQAIEATIRALRGPILVTGASGFIGANLFKLIASHTANRTGLGRLIPFVNIITDNTAPFFHDKPLVS